MQKQFLYGTTATETQIRNSILDYLKLKGYVCKRNNSGFVFLTGPTGKKRAINVGESGWPDIEGIAKKGQWFGIEVKTATGKMSAEQLIMQNRIVTSGGLYILARSLDDVINAGL